MVHYYAHGVIPESAKVAVKKLEKKDILSLFAQGALKLSSSLAY
ncbi:hypothetical protein [Salipaludibacillus sp. LMS25]|jgi:hypothetical protein|nr:hypothetical protein [Salipaludibacillus sp. LMS25]